MGPITITQYFMGRDEAYAADCTLAVRRNAASLLTAVNALLELAASEGVRPGVNQATHNAVASGWRPPAVNDRTSHAAKASRHIEGLAIDLAEQLADRALARWCLRNVDELERLGLYMEDPRWTPSWVHLQLGGPASGKRVFIPSSAPALALALPEQAVA